MRLFKKIVVAGLAATALAASLLPAEAMPIAPAVSAPASDVVNIQYHRHDRGGDGWYRGHRGYRDYRPGYRNYNGYWFPLAAFGAGAIIGGAIASQPRYVEPAPAYNAGINPRHYEWCSARYRSYDSYSNTFQTNYGGRQQCLSPYY